MRTLVPRLTGAPRMEDPVGDLRMDHVTPEPRNPIPDPVTQSRDP